jgi:hypothetical protein
MATPTASAALTNASAVGPGPTADALNTSMVAVVSGDVTDGIVRLEASHDGINWVILEGIAPRSQGGINHCMTNKGAFRYWRANIVSEIIGGTVSATLMEAG